MKSVLVEGWRFITHSYAVVNQYQCLELLRRPEISLYHGDRPFDGSHWKAVPGSLPADRESALRSIPPPPRDQRVDVVLRMDFPHRFDADPRAERTYVWVTDEFQRITRQVIAGGKDPADVLPNTQAEIIACSRWAADGFLNAGAPPRGVHIVPCGVDTSIFHPLPAAERTALRKRLGWDGRFVVLNVSAMTGNKGMDLVLSAVAELSVTHPHVALSLKGSDSLYPSRQWATGILDSLGPGVRNALAPRTSYQGEVLSAGDMANLYRAADLYLSPYRAEGFNLPVLEAAACGLPVVCTRGGSTDDFVDDSWCLRVDSQKTVDPSVGTYLAPDPSHLMAILNRVVIDDQWRNTAAAAGPAWVQSRYTWKHSVDTLLEVLFPLPEGVHGPA